ncbi:DUF2232 domain-containing protein [Desulfobacterales bacterium HSG2]|nr:DUF2232 domain-containing protein [Desulfobacterales bacterium HSG2]
MPQTIQREISKNIATGIAITILIFVVVVYTPIIGFFCSLFIPLPILFYRSKLGRTNGTVVLLVSVVIVTVLLGGTGIDMLFFAELMMIGFVLSELMEMNLSVEKTVGYACVTVISAGIITLLIYSDMSLAGIIRQLSGHIRKILDHTIIQYEKMGMPQEVIHKLLSQKENIIYLFIRIIPGLLISFTLFVSWITLLASELILKKRGLFYPDFGSLKSWKPPEFLVWGVIGCGSAFLFSNVTFKIFALNGLFILITIYFFGGIAIVSFYFEEKHFPLGLKVSLYSLAIVLQPFVMLLLISGLGFFDLWLNFRKLETKKSL